MPQLARPSSEHEMAERLDEIDMAIGGSESEGIIFTPGMRVLLNRYALGEIAVGEFRALVGDAIDKPRLDLCH